MEIADFFYPLFLIDEREAAKAFLGTAFPVAPGGGLLTARHVLDVPIPDGQQVAVLDLSTTRFIRIESQPLVSANPDVDLAFIPGALSGGKAEFFPLLEPSKLLVGEDVYSFGFFSIGGSVADIERGYFSGDVVSFLRVTDPASASILLPYAVLEGMSGSPVLTYHNGPKLVGVATGNRESRIVASQAVDYEDDRRTMCETISRIVEFGVAHHVASVRAFLLEVGAEGFVVSETRVSVPGLE